MVMLLCLFTGFGTCPQENTRDSQAIEPTQEILALTPEIRAYLHERVSKNLSPHDKVMALIDVIFSEKGLGLTYGNHRTKTAVETFASREGNCLSFTSLFVAMARELGLPAQFQEVLNVSTYNKRGQVVINNKHMNALVMVNGRRMVVDFYPYADRKQQMNRTLKDTLAFAHYYNNKGAEAFTQGAFDLAQAYFQKAAEVAPEFSRTFSNMGVLHKRLGEYALAEQAYRQAIALDREDYTAMSNLAQLYQALGKEDLANDLERKVERHRNRNPYYHFALGLEKYEAGRYRESLAHFHKATRLHPRESDFFHALARSHWQLGESEEARRYLQLAERFAMSEDDRDRFHSKLDALLAQQ